MPVDALKIQTRAGGGREQPGHAPLGPAVVAERAGRRDRIRGDLPTLTYAEAAPVLPPSPRAERDCLRDAAANRPELASQDHEDPRRRADRGRRPEGRVASRRLARFAHPVRFDNPLGFAQLVGRLLPAAPAT